MVLYVTYLCAFMVKYCFYVIIVGKCIADFVCKNTIYYEKEPIKHQYSGRFYWMVSYSLQTERGKTPYYGCTVLRT